MKSFTDLLKYLESNEKFLKTYGLINEDNEMKIFQERIAKSFTAINKLSEINESIRKQKKQINASQTLYNGVLESINLQEKFNIPQNVFDSLKSIKNQRGKVFNDFTFLIGEHLKNPTIFSKLNYNYASNNLTEKLSATIGSKENWSLLEDLNDISDEAVLLTERINKEKALTTDHLIEIRDLFKRIDSKIEKIDAEANNLFWKFIMVVGFILAITGELRNWLPKPENATNEDLKLMIEQQFTYLETKLKLDKEYIVSNRSCKVYLKPKNKSIVLDTLPKDFEIIVLQINHKWVYVSYNSASDQLPQTGWVLKKYLKKLQN